MARCVSLTEKDLATKVGVKLLEALEKILGDGRLSDGEIKALNEWLDRAAKISELPGLYFLKEEITCALADGKISEAENRLLRNSLLKVLPPIERDRAKARVAEAKELQRERDREARRTEENSPTEKQLDFLRDLGGSLPAGATRQQASEMIDQLLAGRPTYRQKMVLRFWNRLDLLTAGVDGVSAWMDEWYQEDPDRLAAWELWKLEVGDSGRFDPNLLEKVPIGGGQLFINQVKNGTARK